MSSLVSGTATRSAASNDSIVPFDSMNEVVSTTSPMISAKNGTSMLWNSAMFCRRRLAVFTNSSSSTESASPAFGSSALRLMSIKYFCISALKSFKCVLSSTSALHESYKNDTPAVSASVRRKLTGKITSAPPGALCVPMISSVASPIIW